MDTQHARHLIPDYVLGLLTAEERLRVEQHARQCAACREAIGRERQVEALVRQAVHNVAAPRPGRLHRLRPSAPTRAERYRRQLTRQLAPLTAVVVLLALALLAQAGGLEAFRPALAQTISPPTVTMTSTHTPTATLAAVDPSVGRPFPASTRPAGGAAVLMEPPRPFRSTTPPAAPVATPIITTLR